MGVVTEVQYVRRERDGFLVYHDARCRHVLGRVVEAVTKEEAEQAYLHHVSHRGTVMFKGRRVLPWACGCCLPVKVDWP